MNKLTNFIFTENNNIKVQKRKLNFLKHIKNFLKVKKSKSILTTLLFLLFLFLFNYFFLVIFLYP
jgi:hypothetical protein